MKTWFVTGASRGLGFEICRAALDAGHQVVATARDAGKIADALAIPDGRLLTLALDVTDPASIDAAVAAARKRFGRIDVLVNNAGYGQLGMFEENTAAEIQRQFDTNVFGLFHVTRAVLPVMRKQRSGRIFNLSSMAGMIGFPHASIYCASKFAIEGFSESLALDVADFGIRVTSVEPGFTRTDFLESSSIRYGTRQIEDYQEASAKLRAHYGQYNGQQAGDPVKLANALLTLANSDNPPLHFASGSDAFEGMTGKLASVQSELQSYRQLSTSIDGTR